MHVEKYKHDDTCTSKEWGYSPKPPLSSCMFEQNEIATLKLKFGYLLFIGQNHFVSLLLGRARRLRQPQLDAHPHVRHGYHQQGQEVLDHEDEGGVGLEGGHALKEPGDSVPGSEKLLAA